MDKGLADSIKQNKRPHDDADKDKGHTDGSDRRKSPTTYSKSGKCAKNQVEEPIFVQDFDYTKHYDVEFDNTDMLIDQGEQLGKTNEQPNDEVVHKNKWYKKSRRDTSPVSLKILRKGQCVLVPAFCLLRFGNCVLTHCVLALRFGSAFCLVEDLCCVLLRRDSAQLKTSLRFVSKAGCVLLQDKLRFASRQVAFCFKSSCVLLQD
nr:hypothetical protein [Tanacetum cinerariifolium]